MASRNLALEKVKKNCPDKSDDECRALAQELTDQTQLLEKFRHLFEYADDIIEEIQDSDDEAVNEEEEAASHDRAKHGVASILHLPIKLRLSKLQRLVAPGFSHKFTALLRYEYGPLHAALEVGSITLEWGRESLVIPHYNPAPVALFTAHVHNQGEWFNETYKQVKHMSLADRLKDHTKKIEILQNAVEKKEELLKKLVDVIIDYNSNKKYSMFSCNCQHFVLDALTALGIKDPPEFRGHLGKYIQSLKHGKKRTPEFESHEQLDAYVTEKLRVGLLPQDEAEYLLCQYFQFHLPSIEAAENEEEWECEIRNCKCSALEERVQERALLLNPFLTKRGDHLPVSRKPQVAMISEGDEEVDYDHDFVGSQETAEQREKRLRQEEEDEILAKAWAGNSDQEHLLIGHTGYIGRVSAKLRDKYPDKSTLELQNLAEILASEEQFRAKYVSEIIDGLSERLVLEATTAQSELENNQLPPSEALELSRKQLQAASNIPIKFLVHTRCTYGQDKIVDAPLEGFLLIGNHAMQWNESSLVNPIEVSALQESRPVYKGSVKLKGWSDFLKKQQPRIRKAIEERGSELEVTVLYDLTQEKDKVFEAFVRVCVEYNRNKQYDSKTCNNQHFIKEVCHACGIKNPPEICPSIKKQLKTLKPSRKVKRNFVEHKDLDDFVKQELEAKNLEAYKPNDIDYLIGQYFLFHIANWNESNSLDGWKCMVPECQLEELERYSSNL